MIREIAIFLREEEGWASNEKVHKACEVRLRLFFADLMDLLQERCFSQVIDPDTLKKRRIGYIHRYKKV